MNVIEGFRKLTQRAEIDDDYDATREITNVSSIKMEEETERESKTANKVDILVLKPTRFDDCTVLCARFREKYTLVVDFADADEETRHRILDFLSGVVCALDGDLFKISTEAYIAAPEGIQVQASEIANEEDVEVKEG